MIVKILVGHFVRGLLNLAQIRQHYWPGDRVRRIDDGSYFGEGWIETPSWRGDGWYRVRFDQGSSMYIHFSDLEAIHIDEEKIPEDLKKIRELLRGKV